MVAVDLSTGALRWTYQPHPSNRDDLDFAGRAEPHRPRRPRRSPGSATRTATYYLVDRATGAPVATVDATQPGLTRPGGNFSTGGFIGPAGVRRRRSSSAAPRSGPRPYLHGIDVATGTIAWQNQEPSATYAATAIAGNVAIVGGTDFTLRAVAVDTGHEAVVAPDEGRGRRAAPRSPARTSSRSRASASPGSTSGAASSGVYRFSLHGKRGADPRSAAHAVVDRAVDRRPQACVGSPCALPFDLKKPPAGLHPDRARSRSPSTRSGCTSQADGPRAAGGLAPARHPGRGRPARPRTRCSSPRATTTRPAGWSACSTRDLDCTGEPASPAAARPTTAASIVAVKDAHTVPTLADGFERLVTTVSFDPPLQPTTTK